MKTFDEAVSQFSDFWQGILAILVGAMLGLFLIALALVNQL